MSEHVIETETSNGALFIPYQAKLSEAVREEVVRCRDCVYYERDPNPIDPGWPMMCADSGRDMLEPDGFCKWGEPKGGGNGLSD